MNSFVVNIAFKSLSNSGKVKYPRPGTRPFLVLRRRILESSIGIIYVCGDMRYISTLASEEVIANTTWGAMY